MKQFLILLFLLPLPAFAQIEGLWQTEPDRKSYISHIRIAPCEVGYCAKVEAVFTENGKPVQVQSLGKRLFWDMMPQEDGTYGGGTALVPLLNVTTQNVQLRPKGTALEVQGRIGPLRGKQLWTRLE